MARNYTQEQARSILTTSNIVSSRVYELLPDIIRANDPLLALKGFFGAVQEEYDRNKQSIRDILLLVDPLGINNDFILEGSPTFLDTGNQFLQISNAGNTVTPFVTFAASPQAVAGDDYYNGFAVYVWDDPTTPASIGQYRRIVDYTGSTRTATLDVGWAVVPSANATMAICFPDRVWIPTEVVSAATTNAVSPSVLPNQGTADWTQGEVILPNLHYISDRADFYIGWKLVFLDGDNKGGVFIIDSYAGDNNPTPFLATTTNNFAAPLAENDWFKLIPPEGNKTSTTDNFYKDRYIRILSATSDATNGYQIQIENRRIIRSEYDEFAEPAQHICYIADDVTGEGERWEYPPDPTFYFGITNHYVSLGYLARQLGWRLDSLDPEELQREQLRQAFNFYKLKGTKRAMELIIKSFGLNPFIQEQSSNYTSAPHPTEVGSDPENPLIPSSPVLGTKACDPPHTQHNWQEITPQHIEGGFGQEEIPCSYLPGGTQHSTVRIPDSDIKIFVSRINPKVVFDPTILERIIDKIEDVRPIHVEIILIGFLEQVVENVIVTESLTITGASTSSVLDVDAIILGEGILAAESRYDDLTDSRYDIEITTRYDLGTV